MDEPVGKDVGVGLDRDDGVGKEWVSKQPFVISPERTCRVLGPINVFDEGSLYRLPIGGMNNEVGETAVVGLEALGTFSELDEAGKCGGVVRWQAAVGAMPPPLATSYG